MKNIIHINAKCSDMFAATLSQDDKLVGEYDGYVPNWMPGQHYGDYVELSIDADTGQIVNWKRPTQRDLLKTFNKPVID